MMEFLGPLIDILFVVLLVRQLIKAFSGGGQPRAQRRPQAPPAPAAERDGGKLVRDPQCGTYIQISRAIRVGSGDQATYFCSPMCRDAYAATHPR